MRSQQPITQGKFNRFVGRIGREEDYYERAVMRLSTAAIKNSILRTKALKEGKVTSVGLHSSHCCNQILLKVGIQGAAMCSVCGSWYERKVHGVQVRTSECGFLDIIWACEMNGN